MFAPWKFSTFLDKLFCALSAVYSVNYEDHFMKDLEDSWRTLCIRSLKNSHTKVAVYQITLDSDGWTSQLSSRNISCLSISYQVSPWVGFALPFCIFAVVWRVFAQPYCPCCSILQGIQFVFWQVEGQRPCQAVGSGNEAMPSVPSEGIVSQQGWCHQIGLPLKGSFACLLCDYFCVFFVLVCIICLYCQLREYTIDSE